MFVSGRDGNLEIYVMGANGANPTRLTTNTAIDEQPAWSPDGKIIFASNRDGDYEIYVMNADGSNPLPLTNNTTTVDYRPMVSPGGNKIAFTSSRDGNFEIYVMDASGANPRA